jgi:hypothetical protein
MKASQLKKIIKDHNLNLSVQGRSNQLHNVALGNANDIATLSELLGGMNHKLVAHIFAEHGFYVIETAGN